MLNLASIYCSKKLFMAQVSEHFTPGDDFINQSIKVSALQRLEILRSVSNENEITFTVSEDPIPSKHGLVYKTQVKVKNGAPVRGEGTTPGAAKEKAAEAILNQLKIGALFFNPKGQLEFHRGHENKFTQKKKRR